MIISSQKYLDENIVAEKIENNDFVVTLATIEYDGETYQIVIDGHHSLAAAIESGNNPEFIESDYNYQKECDYMGFDNFMAANYVDSDWYDVETGYNVW